MEKIMDHYGAGLLALVTGLLVINMYFGCIASGGELNDIIRIYMVSICGSM